eukprot:3426954-Rhodomonas_salina.2
MERPGARAAPSMLSGRSRGQEEVRREACAAVYALALSPSQHTHTERVGMIAWSVMVGGREGERERERKET